MTKLTLTQPDWTRFMDPNGLAEKAGVPVEALSIKRPLTSSKHWGLGALAKSSF